MSCSDLRTTVVPEPLVLGRKSRPQSASTDVAVVGQQPAFVHIPALAAVHVPRRQEPDATAAYVRGELERDAARADLRRRVDVGARAPSGSLPTDDGPTTTRATTVTAIVTSANAAAASRSRREGEAQLSRPRRALDRRRTPVAHRPPFPSRSHQPHRHGRSRPATLVSGCLTNTISRRRRRRRGEEGDETGQRRTTQRQSPNAISATPSNTDQAAGTSASTSAPPAPEPPP